MVHLPGTPPHAGIMAPVAGVEVIGHTVPGREN